MQKPYPPEPALPQSLPWRLRFNAILVRYPLLSHLLLALLWLGMWRASALLEYAPHASIWFPPAGVSFAALLLVGRRALPSLWVCGLISTFWENSLYQSQHPWPVLVSAGVLFALAHSLSYWLGAAFIQLLAKKALRHNLPKIILTFLLVGPMAALLATAFGTQALALGGVMPEAAARNIWLAWWIGDLIGVVVLTPLFVSLVAQIYPKSGAWLSDVGLRQEGGPLYGYLTKLLLSALLLTLAMVLTAQFHYQEVAFSVFFLCIPQMWIVYTENPLRGGLSLAILSTLTALWIKLMGLSEHALIYQFAINVLAASTYFGLTVPVLVSHNVRLRELALEDNLTKVASRNHFFDQAQQELQRAAHYRQPIALVVFDIDHFKDINDSLGHSAGDSALRQVAKAARQQLRQADLLGRFGGDEFLLLLPGSNLAEAQVAAHRLRRALQGIRVKGPEQPLSGSFGVVEVAEDEDIFAAFDRADGLLLEAKRLGRNRVQASPAA
ncbi:sensor domain-containing diguanylate cyclase [Gallaecimonas xiamenensis]|uniref:diguanylate cyclase n=1 Tax=Gallaecimonas xiamenensis 3-C-1 TaxID=745411 RepID=K2J1B3_9GAMM|nr:diguanylate cyclase [Gallaecimonas xiamenensis]EKE68928.1 diguanylate cyclase [Gallaecimonas xiamenensis 3-C-1]